MTNPNIGSRAICLQGDLAARERSSLRDRSRIRLRNRFLYLSLDAPGRWAHLGGPPPGPLAFLGPSMFEHGSGAHGGDDRERSPSGRDACIVPRRPRPSSHGHGPHRRLRRRGGRTDRAGNGGGVASGSPRGWAAARPRPVSRGCAGSGAPPGLADGDICRGAGPTTMRAPESCTTGLRRSRGWRRYAESVGSLTFAPVVSW
jgi:hypothetical protein